MNATEKKYSDLRERTKKLSTKIFFWKKSESDTSKWYSYETIPLKLYFEIARTGKLNLLAIGHNPDPEKAFERWEKILVKNQAATGVQTYNVFQDNYEVYGILLAEYNVIKAMIVKLHFEIDDECIDYLEERGYRIETSGAKKYLDSLVAASRKSEHIGTQIKSKLKELEEMHTESDGEQLNLDEILATLSVVLEFEVKDDITLAKFNQYQKVLKKKTEGTKPKEDVGD